MRGKSDEALLPGEQGLSVIVLISTCRKPAAGNYDSSTGKFTASGTCTLFTKEADGEYKAEDDNETYEAFFSKAEDGKVLYETANGILLEYSEDWVN